MRPFCGRALRCSSLNSQTTWRCARRSGAQPHQDAAWLPRQVGPRLLQPKATKPSFPRGETDAAHDPVHQPLLIHKDWGRPQANRRLEGIGPLHPLRDRPRLLLIARNARYRARASSIITFFAGGATAIAQPAQPSLVLPPPDDKRKHARSLRGRRILGCGRSTRTSRSTPWFRPWQRPPGRPPAGPASTANTPPA
jgi:hypothetical protein